MKAAQDHIAAALFATLLAASFGHASDPLTLVDGGRPRAVVVLSDTASDAVSEAALDMVDIIRRMSGVELEIRPKSARSGRGPALVLGLDDGDSSLAPLAYHVRREGNVVDFSGGNTMGVVNGVYGFLERELGCRWYAPGPLGEYVPSRTTIAVGELDMSDAPDFENVSGFGPYPDGRAGRLWLLRNGLVGFPNPYHGHNWNSIVHPSVRDERPELFSFPRGGAKFQLCTTHPDVIDSATAAARRYFDRSPGNPMFSLSPNDNGKFCQCERCRALDRELGVDRLTPKAGRFTPRLVYFCNQVAERLVETHPDKYLAFYAYMSHTAPPATIRPHPNLIPVVCKTPWAHCAHHAIDDPQCERNRRIADALRGWTAVSSNVWVHEYYGHYHWYGPYGLLHTIRCDMSWMRARGVVGFTSETHANWWTQGLNSYVAVKLAWDLGADVDAIVRDYYAHLYGPAARHMSAYGQRFEDLLQGASYDRDWEESFVEDVTPGFVANAALHLDSAEAVMASAPVPERARDAVVARLRKVRAGHRLMAAQAQTMRKDPDGSSPMPLLARMESDPELQDVVELGLARGYLSSDVARARPYRRAWDRTTLTDRERADLIAAFRDNRTLEVARGLGFITDWRIIGLFAATPGRELATRHPPERETDFSAVYEGRHGEVGWQRHRTMGPYGVVDLGRLFWPLGTDSSVAYLYAEVELDRNDPYAQVRLGSNDGVVLWHNGERVLLSDTERPLTLDQDRLTIRVRPGKNTFLAKVNNTDHNFEFAMRLLTRDNRPMRVSAD